MRAQRRCHAKQNEAWVALGCDVTSADTACLHSDYPRYQTCGPNCTDPVGDKCLHINAADPRWACPSSCVNTTANVCVNKIGGGKCRALVSLDELGEMPAMSVDVAKKLKEYTAAWTHALDVYV